MEETTQYHQCSKDDLIEIIMDRDRTIADRDQAIADLKKEVEALKHPVRKNNTNGSIPSSKELIPRTRSQRDKSGKKPGGHLGHVAHHRERNPHPGRIQRVPASHCGTGSSRTEARARP